MQLAPPRGALVRPDHDAFRVFGAPLAAAGGQIGERFARQVEARVREDIELWLADQGVGQIGPLAWRYAHFHVRHHLREPVRELALRLGTQACGGSYDAAWLAKFAFFGQCGVDVTALAGHMMVSRAAGQWWPLPDVAVLTERPTTVARDATGQVHSSTGPALRYPDGWELYAWHGVWVPRRVVLAPDSLTVQEILGEPDVDLRRVMIERFGMDRFVHEASAVVLDQDDRSTLYQLAPLGRGEEGVLLLVCIRDAASDERGFGRGYWLRVASTTRTVADAVAQVFDDNYHDYAPRASLFPESA
jgi:hypothetical protein